MQKKWLKALRLLGLALLIVLAVLGVGLSGAAVAFQTRKRAEDPEIKIELVETKRGEKEAVKQLEINKP